MKSKKALHPLLLNFADIECYLTEERVFVRNLICWSTEEDEDICWRKFILEALYDRGRTVERSLTQGAKILYFESGNLIFKDSMNFLAMALDKFPSTFHLQELHKGFFPHAFNLECHFKYSGPYLSVENYNPDDMESKKRDQFLKRGLSKVRPRVPRNRWLQSTHKFIHRRIVLRGWLWWRKKHCLWILWLLFSRLFPLL